MATASTIQVEQILSRPAYLLYPEENFIPVEEYLGASYRPDMDYVDGHTEVRNLGEYEHGELQGVLLALFHEKGREWNVRVVPECRLQVKADRFRVPDLMVLARNEEKPKRIVRTAPLLCIEVLSPKDTFARIQSRIADYIDMGVRNVWLFDPKDLGRVYVYHDGVQEWLGEPVLLVADTAVRIKVDEIAKRIAAN